MIRNSNYPKNDSEKWLVVKAVYFALKLMAKKTPSIKADDKTCILICKIIQDCDFLCTPDEAIRAYLINKSIIPPGKMNLNKEEKVVEREYRTAALEALTEWKVSGVIL